ncbi:MAG: RES family NAD+ phosphorylase [Lautropia sp.]|nr:RES family NAD+ phosphorylase [Lautropia sp.]
MILTNLPAETTLYRAHSPRWAYQPLSGQGAAMQGGRFNRPGIPALYLSFDELTALHEYRQSSPFLPPCTLCSYSALLQRLVDLRELSFDTVWDGLWHSWREDWRLLKFDRHIEPPSWILGDLVLSQGHTGIIFPSLTRERGLNVVVYNDQLKDGNTIVVNDPEHRLPHNADSWV